MKVVHISDIHIHDQEILGQDPIANFRSCLAHVETHHGDADRVVITGDLTHHGLRRNYEALRDMLAGSPLTPRLMIGNHDDRANFRAVFDTVPVDADGHVQYAEDTPAGRFLYLDTAEAGTHAGHYGPDRRAWLSAELDRARADDVPVFVFMHHHPCPVGAQSADMIGLVDGAAFRSILAGHQDRVRHLFFGHCHFTLSGSVLGIPMSAPRSTNHPNAPDLQGGEPVMGTGPLAQTYDVCLIEPDWVVVHGIDFNVEVQWVPLGSDGWIDEVAAED